MYAHKFFTEHGVCEHSVDQRKNKKKFCEQKHEKIPLEYPCATSYKKKPSKTVPSSPSAATSALGGGAERAREVTQGEEERGRRTGGVRGAGGRGEAAEKEKAMLGETTCAAAVLRAKN